MDIIYGTANDTTDLHQILELQSANLSKNLSREERIKEGFVTVQHDFETLEMMNRPFPHIIAKHGDDVVAYALTMLPSMADKVPVLVPMFEMINDIVYEGKPLSITNYIVMGQICIAKEYRGIGIFQNLYIAMQNAYAYDFQYLITEISANNYRSQKAHKKVGFQVIKTFEDATDKWQLVLWKW